MILPDHDSTRRQITRFNQYLHTLCLVISRRKANKLSVLLPQHSISMPLKRKLSTPHPVYQHFTSDDSTKVYQYQCNYRSKSYPISTCTNSLTSLTYHLSVIMTRSGVILSKEQCYLLPCP